MQFKKVRKAVIPAAGFGTRFLPATKAMPKEMLPIVDTPTIQYIVEEILASGIEEILIISGHAKRAIEDHFDSELLKEIQRISEIRVHYVRQKHMRGLGDAILCARSFVDREPFAVILGDDVVYNEGQPALSQLIDVYDRTGSTVLGCQEVPEEEVSSYGIVKGTAAIDDPRLMKVSDMVEKPEIAEAPSRMAVLGRYVITPDIFPILEETQPGKGGEIQLTDALRVLAKNSSVWAYAFEGRRYDVGSKEGFLEATVEYALRRDDLGPAFAAYLKRKAAEL